MVVLGNSCTSNASKCLFVQRPCGHWYTDDAPLCDFCMNVFTELGPMKVDAATIFFQETLPE